MESPLRYPDLEQKRILITGASGGLGAAMARAFGAHGARVIVHYRTRQQGAEQVCSDILDAGSEAVMLQADLRSETALNGLADQAWAQWDGIDILINNAGVVLKSAIQDAEAAHWDDTMNINLRAPYLLSRRIAGRMIDAERAGVILHNSSIHATSSVQHFSAYAASKAALESLGRVQALEWAPYNIRVNCFAPGVVPVERTQQALEAAKDQWMPHMPMGRFGTGDDIAELALFLASNASAWTTGQSYIADGGMLSRMDMPNRPRPDRPAMPDPIED
jgi:glucose 1-dehydrogenase